MLYEVITLGQFGGQCFLRFDDTNPAREDVEYVDAIMRDIRWLGFDWGEHLYHASDYFEQIHGFAVQLIEAGKAVMELEPLISELIQVNYAKAEELAKRNNFV